MLSKLKKKWVKPLIIIGILVAWFFVPLLFFSKPSTILLSFDTELVDSDETIRDLLGVLAANDIQATFFVMGKLAEERPYIVEEIHNAGHEISCHTYSHRNLKKLNYSEQESEIVECMFAIEDAIGELPTGFRAPYRRENTATQQILRESAFNYDASSFENVPLFFPEPQVYDISTSSYSFLMLSDYVMLKIYKVSPEVYFSILANKPGKTASFAFHPRIIMQHKQGFNALLKYWKANGVGFITHDEIYWKVIAAAG